MQGNDIAQYAPLGQGVVFDGLLASPPSGRIAMVAARALRSRNDWDGYINRWEPNEIPIKALSDCVNRLGIGTDVYTFISEGAAEAIERWLFRKGISVPVYYHESPQMLEYDLRFNREVRIIYTSDAETAQVLGPRASVASTERGWTP